MRRVAIVLIASVVLGSLTSCAHHRGAQEELAAVVAEHLEVAVETRPTVAEAMAARAADTATLVTGSIYVVGEARRHLTARYGVPTASPALRVGPQPSEPPAAQAID